MMPLPKRYLTAMMLDFNGSSFLVDCGEGTQVAIRSAGLGFHDIDNIFITHTHGDHVSGLPGLLMSMGNADRLEPVMVYGPMGTERVLRALCIIAPRLPFEVKVIEMAAPIEQMSVNGLNVTAFAVKHGIPCYGYSFTLNRAGRFDPEKAKENNVPMKVWSRLQKGATVEFEGSTYTQDMILGPPRKGLKVTYCTDTVPVDAIWQCAADSDLFICEGEYGEIGSEAKAAEHMHMNFNQAARLAKKAKAAQCWLTHYSPSLVHPEQFIEKTCRIYAPMHVGNDGMKMTLKYRD
jgi:ribonuclease Z